MSINRLRAILSYDPETGIFIWKRKTGRRCKIGERAGCKSPMGYRQIQIDRVVFKEHRLAWAHFYGCWPKGELDHKNRKRWQNNISNLREATRIQNVHNRSNKNTKLGVRFRNNKWQARINIKGKLVGLGTYKTLRDGVQAYNDAAKNHRGEFAVLNIK